jgi:hypothetical protein
MPLSSLLSISIVGYLSPIYTHALILSRPFSKIFSNVGNIVLDVLH